MYLIPPSAITGTLLFILLQISNIAENWGYPTPATILVVQIDPGPIPTLIASAPALIKNFAASTVAMFPTIISTFLYIFLRSFRSSTTLFVWPWAVSITIASTPEFIKASALSIESFVTPIAAATLNLPYLSLFAIGFNLSFVISLKVINPTSLLALVTTGNFSILFCCRITSASSNDVPTPTVMRFSFVITSVIILLFLFSNLISLFVTIPFKKPESSTIGIPPILFSFILFFASETVESKGKVIGSIIIPLSARLTLLTLSAWFLIDIFLWITPIPPSWAMAIAILLSVTVSIAAETIGMFNDMFLENLEFILTSEGNIVEYPGTNRTSSYVKASEIIFFWRGLMQS